MIRYGIDFTLSHRYNIVEQMIFKFVLAGVYDMNIIASLMCIYSDDVLANAVKHLVNYQIVEADVVNRIIRLSNSILSLIEACNKQSVNREEPIDNEKLYITDVNMKERIMKTLFPEVNMEFLVKSVDFILIRRSILDE